MSNQDQSAQISCEVAEGCDAIKQWIDRDFAEVAGDSKEFIPYPLPKK